MNLDYDTCYTKSCQNMLKYMQLHVYSILKSCEKVGKWILLCCTVGYKWVTV